MSSAKNDRKWVKPPVQSRSQRTMDALLDAAESLLHESSFTMVSVADITKKAGSSVGAFYARFEDKIAILHALHERYVDQAHTFFEDKLDPNEWSDASLDQRVQALCEVSVQHADAYVGVRRGTLLMSAENATFLERSRDLEHFHVETIQKLLAASHPLGDRDAVCIHRTLYGSIDHRSLMGDLRPSNGAELVRELSQLISAYLRADPQIVAESI